MTFGVLSGKAIEDEIRRRAIVIHPFNPAQLNPVSYDLTLGSEVKVYEEVNYFSDSELSQDGRNLQPFTGISAHYLDAKKDNPTKTFKIGKEGWVLKPGVGYLMHTHEKVWAEHHVPVLDGKSSVGRLFISVHVTAGYGDPNFFGQYTLEVVALHPVRVYAGMRIAQIRFHTISGEITPYNGNYVGSDAIGAVASKSWNQFKEEVP